MAEQKQRTEMSERTIKVRRSLLVTSLVSLGITDAGMMPTKIRQLGIELSEPNQVVLLWALLASLVYLLIGFILRWKVDKNAAQPKGQLPTFSKTTEGLYVAYEIGLPVLIALVAIVGLIAYI